MLTVREFKKAEKIITKVGHFVARHYGNLQPGDVSLKQHQERVTKIDLQANEMLTRDLTRLFPQHDILSEEADLIDKPSAYRWILDPIDGTSNFVAHIPFFSVAVALMHGDEIIWSYVYAPILKEKFIAVQGGGATLNGKVIHVSERCSLTGAMVAYGYSHAAESKREAYGLMQHLTDSVSTMRHLGSAALDMCYVACGRMDAVVFASPTKLWDVASGVLIVKEADGVLTQNDGKMWNVDSQNLVASNKKIHVEILRKLS